MKTLMIRNFYELNKLISFNDRYQYLRLSGVVGTSTFGYDRFLNQILYKSRRWLKVRDSVIVRDGGNDLGLLDYPISGKIIVHHMNPISIEDIEFESDDIYNPDYLICCSHRTHEAIHYSDESLLPKNFVDRFSGDTSPWLNRS